jgi:hypothetical protein
MRGAFVCVRCRQVVRDLNDRVVQSVDFMRADGRKRWRRVHVADLCFDCMDAVLQEMGA